MSQPQTTPGFGRRRSVDFRDSLYSIRAIDPLVPPPVGRKQWNEPPVMDQGATSQCVAYSGTAWLAAGPVTNKQAALPWGMPADLYRMCQQNDEWPGEDYDGTSVRALFKVLQDNAIVGSYLWAHDANAVAHWLLTRGPVVFGIDWAESMMVTDAHGFCRLYPEANPRIVGGHAILGIGTDAAKKCPDGTVGAVRLQNSWGRGWGANGRAWISYHDLDILIKSGGEACMATEEKIKPLPTFHPPTPA